MTLLTLSLILISAVMHATWNYLSKRANGGIAFIWLFTCIATVIYAPLFIGAIIMTNFTFTLYGGIFILGSIVLHLIYFLLLFQGYKVGDLSIVYPVSRGFAPMLTTILAFYIFSESLSLVAYMGIALIIVGIFFLTGGLKIFSSKHNFVPVLYGVLIGITISGYTLLDKAVVSVIIISPIILDYLNTLGRLILLTPHISKDWSKVKTEWRDHKREAFGVGILSCLGYIIVLSVLTFTPVSYVAPVREISILFGTIIGVKLLKEGIGIKRAVYSTFIVLGVALTVLPV